jgi:hypothetical protein
MFARKCIVYIPTRIEAKEFIETNHLQGHTNFKYAYALKYDNEILSMMTFSSLRIALGGIPNNNCYELIRFCNKLNTNIVGGASKLIKAFERDHMPSTLISYADRRWSNGNLYKIIGFSPMGFTNPGYWYFQNNSMIREHRYNFRKDRLVKLGFDKTKTEFEIMSDRGYFRIWDCGNSKWVKYY